MPCRIEFAEIELEIRIGCSEEERKLPQPVRIRVSLSSDEHFAASETDRLSDTLDAAEIRDLVASFSVGARGTRDSGIHTLERLGRVLETAIRERFSRAGSGVRWEIAINKPRFGWTYVHSW